MDQSNIASLEQLVRECNDAHNRADSDRSNATHETQAYLEKLELNGITRKAFRMARAYSKMDPDDRAGFDTAYQIARKALGVPVQADMFDDLKPRGRLAKEAEKARQGSGPENAAMDGEAAQQPATPIEQAAAGNA